MAGFSGWNVVRTILLTGMLALTGAGMPAVIVAQTDNRVDPAPSQMDRDEPQNRVGAGGVQAMKLLGAEVKNARAETIGEVASVFLDPNGRVQDVIVSIGGFLGMGERDVAIPWNEVRVDAADGGVVTTLSEDELRALPEYQYRNEALRGQVFGGGSR